jgi:uncharacterized membrane protein YhaH (DUF805 family)
VNLSELFSFQGRVRRLHFWLVRLIGAAALFAVVLLVGALTGMGGESHELSPLGIVGGAVNLALFLAYFWIELANVVKRCHDRNKTGWFILIGLIPIIGGIWLLIDLGFLDGDAGRNQYGPSPKHPESDATVFA